MGKGPYGKVGGSVREQEVLRRIGGVIFPVFLYELLTMIYPKILEFVTAGSLLEPGAALWLLTAENLLMLPIFWPLYRRDRREKLTWGNIQGKGFGGKEVVFAVLGAVCLSRGVNYLLPLTPLPYWFPGYEEASEVIYSGSLLAQVGASVISAPLLEELLMRGLLYGRLKEALGMPRAAAVVSAAVFGIYHGSVVQGIYAFVMGLFFVWVYEACRSLVPAVLAHMAANGASVLAGQITLPAEFYEIPEFYYLLTAGYLLAGVFAWKQIGYFKNIRINFP